MSKLNQQNSQEAKDYTGHAPESGEPTEIGFSHGRPIDRGNVENQPEAKDRSQTGRHFESGRQDATRSSRQ
jgi:hypothetical protein